MIVVGYVDAAGIGRRLFILPGEVSLFVQAKGEVSRGHSSCSNEPCLKGTTRKSHKATKDQTLSCSPANGGTVRRRASLTLSGPGKHEKVKR